MAKDNQGVQTNLLGRICGPNPKALHLWPWVTKKGDGRAMEVALKSTAVESDDVSAQRAEIVNVYVASESDRSSGVKYTLMALDGSNSGVCAEAYSNWFKVRLGEG